MYVSKRISRFCGVLMLLLVALAAVWPSVAAAAFAPYPQITGYRIGQDGNTIYPSAQAACTANAGPEHTGVLTTVFEYPHFIQLSRHCDVTRNSDGQFLGQAGIFYVLGPASCPANSTLEGGQCVCTAPNIQNAANNGCEAPVCQSGPAGFHRGVVDGEKVNPFQSCIGGCITTVAPRLDLGIKVTVGTPIKTYATFELTRNGNTCNGENSSFPPLPIEDDITNEAPSPEAECTEGTRRAYLANGTPTCQPIPVDRYCPPGYTYGTINGKDSCVSSGSSPPTSTSPTSTDKGTSTETKETTTEVTNPDGTTTTTTTKSDGKGGGSTTVTTKSADGKTIETVTKKTGEDGTCKPGTAGCTPTGTPANGVLPTNAVSVGQVGEHGLMGFNIGNSCPANMPLSLGPVGTYSLSFEGACDAAPLVKPVVLLAAAFAALMIVYGALTARTS